MTINKSSDKQICTFWGSHNDISVIKSVRQPYVELQSNFYLYNLIQIIWIGIKI